MIQGSAELAWLNGVASVTLTTRQTPIIVWLMAVLWDSILKEILVPLDYRGSTPRKVHFCTKVERAIEYTGLSNWMKLDTPAGMDLRERYGSIDQSDNADYSCNKKLKR
jgi:hypothetical protein